VYASLRGSVYDPTGAVVPGAQVTVVDNETGFSRPATAQSDGSHEISSILPGTYTGSAKLKGFKKYIDEKVIIYA